MQERTELDIRMEDQILRYLESTDLKAKGHTLMTKNERFNINIDDIRAKNHELAQYIIKNPIKAIPLFEQNVQKILDEEDAIAGKKLGMSSTSQFPVKEKTLKINFTGKLGKNYVTPRGLRAPMLNSLVCVQGIVTKMSIVKSKIGKSYHFIESENTGFVQNYKDQYSIEGQGNFSTKMLPTKDPAGNVMTPEYGYCEYRNVQKIVIQEMPERAPPAQIPRSITIYLEEDLVDKGKPGDRIEVMGLFKCISGVNTMTSGNFRTLIIATGIKTITNKTENSKFTGKDISKIRKFSREQDVYKILSRSVAPTVQGRENIKKSILLQMLGGVEKNLKSRTHLRGDVNILLIGDPSTAKSQMLRYALNLSPIGINTTGRGSSGVGLTAAVTIDKDTGERHLEAGAMVLGDRGLVCIDEFDKMNDADRVAIHEVMEQQTVTIAKAGLHASLNARCSVIAAANPIYSNYDKGMSAAKNIGLPDTLLSRFDLLFLVLDSKNPDNDKKIAERVIRNHSYSNPNDSKIHNPYVDEFYIEPEIKDEEEELKEYDVFERDNEELFGDKDTKIVSNTFLKKYIAYSKSLKDPILDDSVLDSIAFEYKNLRQEADDNNMANSKKLPITVRTLETIIRLATAHAKLRLDTERSVTQEDIEVATKLLRYSIFSEDDDALGEERSTDGEEDNDDDDEERKKSYKSLKSKKTKNDKRADSKVSKAESLSKEIEAGEEEVKNLIDFSAKQSELQKHVSPDEIKLETAEEKKKRSCIFKILAREQRKMNPHVSYSELWKLISQNSEAKTLFPSKDAVSETVDTLIERNKLMADKDNNIYMI
ncbi:unnamed protein product [Moneuplotes crassus]|uniref:DNA replication licensing factor MCM3 n=1 Tax=Euplotes crassus TaxID=5936 RepID=A0AAD1Y7K8_EUPCR|nr:unnamed protein product [Moneuplotes crassus]